MHELVQKYLEEAKAKEQEILDEQARKKKEERDQYLISQGLIQGTERRYSKDYGNPFFTKDEETKMYYYEAPIPVEVSDEEFEEIKKYERFHNNEPEKEFNIIKPYNDSAERTLGTINTIFYVLAWAVAGIIALHCITEEDFTSIWIAPVLVVGATIIWAVVNVYLNISINLHEIRSKIKN